MLEGTAAYVAVIVIFGVIFFIFLKVRKIMKKMAQDEEDRRKAMLDLVEWGNFDDIDENGKTLLMRAIEEGFDDVTSRILEKNPKVNKTTPSGATALHYAAAYGNNRIVEKLLELNADPDPKDNQGRSPLWAAAQLGHSQVVELLIKNGAYIDQKEDVEGMTPLMGAAINGRSRVVETLLNHAADAHLTSNKGWTACKYAQENVGRNMGPYEKQNAELKKMVILLERVEQGLPLRSASANKKKYMDEAAYDGDNEDD